MLLPVGLAGGMTLHTAAFDTVVWLLTYVAATLAVHGIKARVKPELGAPWAVWAAPTVAVAMVIAAIGIAVSGSVSAVAGLALTPGGVFVLAVAALRVHPRRLKRVGWSLAAANVVTLVLLVAASGG
jgi:hypothetical protein